MFIYTQHSRKMETQKKSFRLLIAAVALVFLGACSSQSNLPADDIYYSSKTQNTYKKPASKIHISDGATVPGRPSEQSADDSFDYSSQYQSQAVAATVAGSGQDAQMQSEADTNYQYIDEYYDNVSYADQITRFDRNQGSGFDYYDDYYSGSCGCGSSSNFSLSVGMGFGYGYGYGYGWPHYGWGYPSYGWGYPYYGWGYPYYGYGGSYWGGYNHGYNNGYYPGGGYYPDYGYGGVYYGPRTGNRSGGTNVGRPGVSPGEDEDRASRQRGGTVIAQSSPGNGGDDRGATIASRQSMPENRIEKPAESREQVSMTKTRASQSTTTDRGRLEKPAGQQTQDIKTRTSDTRATSNAATTPRREPKYTKPKSYESIPSRQPRSSQEYVRPAQKTTTSARSGNYNTPTRTKPTVNSNTKSRSGSLNTRSGSQNSSRSLSTPSRSNSSTKTYSAPSRSSNSSRSYSSPSRSSSGGSSSGSRSSGGGGGSRSSSGGGGRR